MSIYDLLLIAMVLGSVAALVAAAGAAVFRRWLTALRWLGGLVAAWVVYLGIGTVIAIATPQRVAGMGEDRCFDEMCFAVTGFERVNQIGSGEHAGRAQGVFYVVDVRISNRSGGRTERELGRTGMLMDQSGRVYRQSADGLKALANSVGEVPALDAAVGAGESVTAKLVFDVPANVARPGFVLGSDLSFNPSSIVIADEAHFLHRPTIVVLE